MNIQQFRYVREAVRRACNLTEAAKALNTSQSGMSKQIKLLETELGIDIFVRRGKRIVSLTRAGEGALEFIERALLEMDNLRRHAGNFARVKEGRLVIATTHNQARYTLPAVLEQFTREFANVPVEIAQVTPKQAALAVLNGEADLALATNALALAQDLVTFDCFSWRHVVIAPRCHPILEASNLSVEALARLPIITYSGEFTGRDQIDAVFQQASITPDIRLSAMDSDVIKAYVLRGLGVGIISEMALEPRDLVERVRGSERLFPTLTTKVALQRGALHYDYVYRFVELLAPHLTGSLVRRACLDHVGARALNAQERALLREAPPFRGRVSHGLHHAHEPLIS